MSMAWIILIQIAICNQCVVVTAMCRFTTHL